MHNTLHYLYYLLLFRMLAFVFAAHLLLHGSALRSLMLLHSPPARFHCLHAVIKYKKPTREIFPCHEKHHMSYIVATAKVQINA